ncbi:MAG: chemotaxis protein CheW [Acutalibacteraceae bacterium]|jgi:two-component system, chemotaxis family, sensor kinase CheA
MDNNMESMLEVYLFEANDLLEHLDEILINCEKANSFDTDSINEIFRIMHTIKGSSAMMQFNGLATISHKVEDLFYYVRENGIDEKYNEELFDLMFRSSDFIKDEIAKVENNEPLTTDIGTFEQEINDFLKKISTGESSEGADEPAKQPEGKQAEPQPQTPPAQPESAPNQELPKQTQAAAEPIVFDPEYPYAVRVYFDEETEMENLRAVILINAIKDVYQYVKYQPDDIETNPASAEEIIKNGFVIFFKDEQGLKSVLKIIENFVYTKNYTVINKPDDTAQEKSGEKNASAQDEQNKQQAQNTAHSVVKQNLINVNLSKLDNLMDLMGEIVITESMVTTPPAGQSAAVDNNFTKASRQLRKLTDELQEIVMSIRMVPISGVFHKMNRIVRDMSKKLDKDVQLVMIGEDTEVDKTIIDNIGDPIMHVVRNAMDHGIETKEERAQTNKPPKGTITLSAQNTGGEIIITITDDGKGIDRKAVLEKAKKQGLVKRPESEYSAREINNFLLMPGFSTNEVVTEYSGRGVGMDVVKKNVEKVGGDVSIESEFGKGTKILFKIPLTLAIVNGMKISVGETVFTIPINNIRQSFKVDQSAIHYDTDMNEIIMVRNQYYPVVRLHKVFGIETEITDISSGIVILVETHEKSFCIFADSLLGEQQVVVKSLPLYLNKYNVKETGITGCAILGDGSISLILDILNLYNNN